MSPKLTLIVVVVRDGGKKKLIHVIYEHGLPQKMSSNRDELTGR